MGAGVDGEAMKLLAVDLVAEVLNTGTDRATLHLPNMEETLALVHRPNQLAAIRTVVQVRKYKKKATRFRYVFHNLIIHKRFQLRWQ